jgi:hypothetical protein
MNGLAAGGSWASRFSFPRSELRFFRANRRESLLRIGHNGQNVGWTQL